MLNLLCARIFVATLAFHAAAAHLGGRSEDQEVRALLQWALENGATFDDRQEVRRTNASDTKSLRGVFARAAIEAGSLLLEIPWEIVVTAPIESTGDVRCSSLAAIDAYLSRAPIEPYAKLLLDSVPDLPSSWPLEAQARLRKLLGEDFPPFELDRRDAWWKHCGSHSKKGIATSSHALRLAIARAAAIREWPDKSRSENATWLTLLPLYDLYNHRNGAWHNTRVVGSVGKPLQMFAHRHISAGEQLYLTYGSGSDRLFENYGFAEDLPQRWTFRADSLPVSTGRDSILKTSSEIHGARDEVSFDIDRISSSTSPPAELSAQFKVTWRSPAPSKAQQQALASKLEELRVRLHAAAADSDFDRRIDPRTDLTWKYAESIEHALSAALIAAADEASNGWKFSYLKALNWFLGAALVLKVVQLSQGQADDKKHLS
jgi:hypothetical protein